MWLLILARLTFLIVQFYGVSKLNLDLHIQNALNGKIGNVLVILNCFLYIYLLEMYLFRRSNGGGNGNKKQS